MQLPLAKPKAEQFATPTVTMPAIKSPELRPVQLLQQTAGVSRNSESLEAILKQQLAEQKKTTSAVAKAIPQKMTMVIV